MRHIRKPQLPSYAKFIVSPNASERTLQLMIETGASMLKDDLGPAFQTVLAHWETSDKRALIVEHVASCPTCTKRRHADSKNAKNARNAKRARLG